MDQPQAGERLLNGLIRERHEVIGSWIVRRRLFEFPALALVDFAAVADAEVDGDVLGDGGEPGAELFGVLEEGKGFVGLDERFLGCVLREGTVAEPAPGDTEDGGTVAFDQFTKGIRITVLNGDDQVAVGSRFCFGLVH